MRVLSGVQPSGKLHLGNYFGMMRPALALQEEHEVFLFIADYHALTTLQDPKLMREYTRDVALDFLACGLDPEKTHFYRQSDVPQVTELSWLLSTQTPMGLLERCHSYKDKTAKGIAASHALFAYPVLMAADILAVQGELVPVGRDQKQHVEVTRDIAQKFNNQFGEVLTMPESIIQDNVAVIPGIDGQKMSKSYNNTIELFGPEKPTRKKIMKIITDCAEVEDVKDPETSTMYQLYKLIASDSEVEALAEQYRAGGMGYGVAKQALFDAFMDYFGPYRKRREELANNLDYVDEVLSKGAKKARHAAKNVVYSARIAMGLE
jgi:tryptophanyl-tRNA synthetase